LKKLKALGTNPEESTDFRIVNFKNWQRQINLLENQNTLWREINQETFTFPYFTE
jgi:aldehyde dehydrogenase (NAD+)